ncbi:MAG: hypothetical protein C0505_01110 [Leptothrix sp. (in: Bacteria)]|nr:hypothetical protein [Leptothrix sp. (in: b-proteobacteria)]
MAVPGAPATGGLFESLRRLLSTTLGIARVRLELFGTELEAEKLRLFDSLWRAALGLLMIGVGLVLAAGFVLLLLQQAYRLAALGVMTLAFIGAGAWLLAQARAGLRASEGGPFALSLGELQRDLDGLRPVSAASRAPAPPPGPPPVP